MQTASQIAVIDRGRIAELGTHDQLQRENGIYKELVSSQTLTFADI